MKKLHIILLTAATLLSISASAQSFRSGYFLDNYTYGYRINPAQVNEKGFLGIAIGNIDLQNYSNIGVGSLLFNRDNAIVTGLNKKVTAEEFLGKLNKNNFISLDESINILSLGISNGERMHTVELNARVMNTENLPYSLFSFAKKGGTGTFDIGGLYADLSVLADLSYGYSMYIMDNLSVGGRIHLLAGLANVNLNANNSQIVLADDKIAVNPNIDVKASGLPKIPVTAEGSIDTGNIGINTSKPIGGFGASIDLGVEYKTDFGLDAMFSITDLGMISWDNAFALNANAAFEYTGGSFGFEGGTLKTDLADIMDVSKIVNFKAGQGTRAMSMMPFNIQAGARYFMPFYDKLSVGALMTYHNAKNASWFDARLGATITPAKLIGFTANIGYGSFGATWGAALDLHLGPINLTAGLDSFIGKMGKLSNVPVPLGKFMENAHIGLCFTF